MVDPVSGVGGVRGPEPGGLKPGGKPEGAPSFQDILKDQIHKVNDLQVEADQAQENLVTSGRVEDIPEVMVAVRKADLAFKNLMQVRNKIIEAYEEILRMRI